MIKNIWLQGGFPATIPFLYCTLKELTEKRQLRTDWRICKNPRIRYPKRLSRPGIRRQLRYFQNAVKKLGNPDVLKSELEDYENKLKGARAQGLYSGKLRIFASYTEGAKAALSLAESLNGVQSIETQFSLIRLQNLTFATIPGELFSTLGVRLKAQDVHVLGYTNGYYMYLADEASYKNNYYEAMSSPFIRGTGEYLIKEILTAKDSFS